MELDIWDKLGIGTLILLVIITIVALMENYYDD